MSSLARTPARVRKRAKSDRGHSLRLAFHELRELIVSGKLLPGTWLIEAELAERLGFSRTPIRGALHWLQRERYVVSSGDGPKTRVIVAPLTKEDARELYSIIGHLEGLAARLTAHLPHAARSVLVRRLREYNSSLAALRDKNRSQANRVFDLDMSFHRTIVEACAGPRLLELHKIVQPQAERYWRLYATAILDDLKKSVDEHRAIIEAIADGDADTAESGIQANWTNGAQRLEKVIQNIGERGSWYR
ncbi:MAG TPA: GntR family transcriptional regulator [Bryobacteraceae bacterium]|jgi:DNA-binding GntR family transcriptional regulator|nr:GntR family transcriptional regulator [Bryobacteraceae bacterium]